MIQKMTTKSRIKRLVKDFVPPPCFKSSLEKTKESGIWRFIFQKRGSRNTGEG